MCLRTEREERESLDSKCARASRGKHNFGLGNGRSAIAGSVNRIQGSLTRAAKQRKIRVGSCRACHISTKMLVWGSIGISFLPNFSFRAWMSFWLRPYRTRITVRELRRGPSPRIRRNPAYVVIRIIHIMYLTSSS